MMKGQRDKMIRYDCPWCRSLEATVSTRDVSMTWFQDGETNPHIHLQCKCGKGLSIEVKNPEHQEQLRYSIRKEQQAVDTRSFLQWGLEFLDQLGDEEQEAVSTICETEVERQ